MTIRREQWQLGVLLALVAVLASYYQWQDHWNSANPLWVLKEARSLAQSGQHAQALRRYQWVHRWSRREDLVDIAELSTLHEFSIKYWADLAKTYAPARQSLDARRDQGEAQLRKGVDSFDTVREILIINEALGEESRTAQLFHDLRKAHPKLAAEHFNSARQQLVRAREYQLCSAFIPDPATALRKLIGYRDSNLDSARFYDTAEEQQQMKQASDEMFWQQAGQLVEILAGAGRAAEAEQIRQQALAVKDTPEARKALDEALRRATQPK